MSFDGDLIDVEQEARILPKDVPGHGHFAALAVDLENVDPLQPEEVPEPGEGRHPPFPRPALVVQPLLVVLEDGGPDVVEGDVGMDLAGEGHCGIPREAPASPPVRDLNVPGGIVVDAEAEEVAGRAGRRTAQGVPRGANSGIEHALPLLDGLELPAR